MSWTLPADAFDRLSTLAPPAGTQRLFGTACVLGGGSAGLVAARVLADHADRPGVPQGYQVHVLLPGGRAHLERFYPGIVAQAVDEGAACTRPRRSRPTSTTSSGSPRPTRSSSPAAGPSSSRWSAAARSRCRTSSSPPAR